MAPQLAGNNEPIHCLQFWNWNWRDYGPEKIEVMVWSARHNTLPTGDMIHHRHMLPTPACTHCNAPVEDPLSHPQRLPSF